MSAKHSMMNTITIVGPESAVTAVPRILGFAPRHSVVILWVSRGTVALAQRADFPTGDADEWAHHLVAIADRVGADAALDIWVDTQPPNSAFVDAVHHACGRRGIPLIATIATDGQSWIDEGVPWNDRRVLPKALRWRGPLREDFTVSPDPGSTWIRRARPLAPAEGAVAIAELMEDAQSEIDRWTHAKARRAVRALQEVRVRDCLLWHVCAAPLVARSLALHLARLLRRVAPQATGQLAVTAAMAFWVAGDGYRASVVLERALADLPGEPLGQMLDAALRTGLPPRTWVEVVRATPFEDCPVGRVCAR